MAGKKTWPFGMIAISDVDEATLSVSCPRCRGTHEKSDFDRRNPIARRSTRERVRDCPPSNVAQSVPGHPFATFAVKVQWTHERRARTAWESSRRGARGSRC